MQVTEGRNLHVLPNLRKFKLKVVPNGYRTAEWTVYMVSSDPGAIFAPPKFISAAVYPVMIVTPDGVPVQNVDAINELFRSTRCCEQEDDVMSVMQYLCKIEQEMGSRTVYNDASHLYNNLTYLTRWDSLVVLTNCILAEAYMLNDAVAYRFHHSLPDEILYLLGCRSTGQFEHMFNWYSCFNDPSCQAVWQSMRNWPAFAAGLKAKDLIFHTSTDTIIPVIPSGVSRIGTVINLMYSGVHAEDFWFDLDTDPGDVPGDVYCRECDPSGWFAKRVSRMPAWRDLVETMIEAMDLRTRCPSLSMMCAHRTFLDELVLYYKTDLQNPVLWMDAFWWSLAASPGLINRSNVHNITT